MIYITTTIEPENGEEFEIMSISLMRRIGEINDAGEYKYTYSGWWKTRSGETKYIKHNYVYNKREESIFELVRKICSDIDENTIKKSNE